MITVKQLRDFIADFPDEATLWAYEGEDRGINFNLPNGHSAWIRASENSEIEDYQERT